MAKQLEIESPEKRKTNLFVKVKKTNKKWVEGEASRKGLSMSEFMDLLLEKVQGL